MARQEKNTRIKGLPPKLVLQQRDARTGSMPSLARISSDNRTGNYGVHFDDTSTIVFLTSSGDVNYGAGVPTPQLTSKFYQKFGQDISSSLSGAGSISKTVAGEHIAYTPGQKWEPYKETAINNWAADGKSQAAGTSTNPAYATGSRGTDVGPGFESPLWSKSKIEIDLTPSRVHSFGINNYLSTSNNYPMAYWNYETRTYEGIGTGREFAIYDSGSSGIQANEGYEIFASGAKMLEEQCIGFTPSGEETLTNAEEFFGQAISDTLFGFAQPMSSFGFPFHPKYHATSSNLIDVSGLITEPFMAEKMVLEFSMSYDRKNTHSFNWDFPITTFFVMNQRSDTNYTRKQTEHLHAEGTVAVSTSGSFYPVSHSLPYKAPDWKIFTDNPGPPFPTFDGIETSRDLLGWMQISHLNLSDNEEKYLGIEGGDGDGTQNIMKAMGRELVMFRNSSSLNPKFDSGPMGPGGRTPAQSFSGKFIMSASLRSPVKNRRRSFKIDGVARPYRPTYLSTAHWHIGTGSGEIDQHASILQLGNEFGTRNGLGRPTGRDLTNTVTQFVGTPGNSTFTGPEGIYPQETYEKGFITTPYLLLPGDKLILGWQVPVHQIFNEQYTGTITDHQVVTGSRQVPIYNHQGNTLEFPLGEAKLVIYGSKVKEGKEAHDTLNQLLTSDSVHEIIE